MFFIVDLDLAEPFRQFSDQNRVKFNLRGTRMVMTKSDLVAEVAQETKLTKADAERAINAVFSGIQGALKKGKEARFIGFGSFAVHQSSAREGRNPRTGEKIKIKASKRPVFRAGKDFKEAVNTGH